MDNNHKNGLLYHMFTLIGGGMIPNSYFISCKSFKKLGKYSINLNYLKAKCSIIFILIMAKYCMKFTNQSCKNCQNAPYDVSSTKTSQNVLEHYSGILWIKKFSCQLSHWVLIYEEKSCHWFCRCQLILAIGFVTHFWLFTYK